MKPFVLVTGASGGIGRAISLKLASNGYSLYLHYNKNKSAIEELLGSLKEYEGEFIPVQADLSGKNGYETLAKQIFSLDGIVHNSGISQQGLFVDLDGEQLDKLINVHIYNPLMLTSKLLPKMLPKKKGNIVVISSIWGQAGASYEVAYSTVKGAQISFVKALSKELALSGIRVNGIAPGAIQTEMLSNYSEEELQLIREEIPLRRLGSPENIADAVHFLLSENASYITGQTIAVNGGWYM